MRSGAVTPRFKPNGGSTAQTRLNALSSTSDLSGLELNVGDPGGVHEGAWPLQRLDDALPLGRQADVAARGRVEGRVDAVLKVLRRRDLQPVLLLPAAEHGRGDGAAAARRRDPRETTGGGAAARRPTLLRHGGGQRDARCED